RIVAIREDKQINLVFDLPEIRSELNLRVTVAQAGLRQCFKQLAIGPVVIDFLEVAGETFCYGEKSTTVNAATSDVGYLFHSSSSQSSGGSSSSSQAQPSGILNLREPH